MKSIVSRIRWRTEQTYHRIRNAWPGIRWRTEQTYHRIRWAWPVWYYVLNRKGRSLYRNDDRPSLSEVQARLIETLRKDGIAIARIADLVSHDQWNELRTHVYTLLESQEMKQKIQNRRDAPASRKDKYYNIELWDPLTLDVSNPILRFIMQDAVLDVINGYMDMWTKLRGMHLWATFPVPPGAKPHASQRWHRDPEDTKMVKVFIYFNDVDEGTGPFNYVQGSQRGGKWRNLFPQQPPTGTYPPDGAVEQAIPSADIFPAIASAGTIIFCDTSGLHRGGYCTKNARYMFQCGFASSASLEPINYDYPPDYDPSSLSLKAQYSLDN